jgi:hypothetical protein
MFTYNSNKTKKKYYLFILVIVTIFICALFFRYIFTENHVTYDFKSLQSHGYLLHKTALLLTTHNTENMEDIYIDVIKWWVKNSSFDIYVVNSSGKYFNTFFDNNRVTVFTFDQDEYTTKGNNSTDYELLSIKKILKNIPSILTDYTMLLKITGKYKLPSLENLIDKIPQHIDIIFQNNSGRYTQNTEVIGFKTDKIIHIINFAQDHGDIFESSMSKIKLKNFITCRLPVIYIPEKFRVKRGDSSILKYL